MADRNYTAESPDGQITCSFSEYEAVFANLDDTGLIQRLEAYRLVGRKGHPLRALWRAYVCSFLMNLPNTNALYRLLGDRPDFRIFCGFRYVPHRTTLNRFITRLSYHADLVESVLAGLTNELKRHLPDLGKEVAVDSTAVWAYSNPNRTTISDPDASWTAKNSARGKGGKEWTFGFKKHLVSDANNDLPLAHFVTTAKRSDSPELPHAIELTEAWYPWFKPEVVIADRGYDSESNHQYLHGKGIIPVIHIRRPGNTKNRWHKGLYAADGSPTCIGQVPMKYVRSDPKKGRLYRCAGCRLKNSQRGGIRHCDWEYWEDPSTDIRVFGVIRRDGPEWKALYRKRQAVERVFKGLKESRRLTRHNVRGLRKFRLHAAMSVMSYQATALVNLKAGRQSEMTWMTRRVA